MTERRREPTMGERLIELLPSIMRRAASPGSLLSAIEASASSLLDPVDRCLTERHAAFEPATCDARWLPMLARWTRLEWLTSEDGQLLAREECARATLCWAAGAARSRGTLRGVETLLRLATDDDRCAVKLADEVAFHSVISLGPVAARQLVLVRGLLRAEMPAHQTFQFTGIGPPGEDPPIDADGLTSEEFGASSAEEESA
jgi:hypothetical protein